MRSLCLKDTTVNRTQTGGNAVVLSQDTVLKFLPHTNSTDHQKNPLCPEAIIGQPQGSESAYLSLIFPDAHGEEIVAIERALYGTNHKHDTSVQGNTTEDRTPTYTVTLTGENIRAGFTQLAQGSLNQNPILNEQMKKEIEEEITTLAL